MRQILDNSEDFAMGSAERMRAPRSGMGRKATDHKEDTVRRMRREAADRRTVFSDYDCRMTGPARIGG